MHAAGQAAGQIDSSAVQRSTKGTALPWQHQHQQGSLSCPSGLIRTSGPCKCSISLLQQHMQLACTCATSLTVLCQLNLYSTTHCALPLHHHSFSFPSVHRGGMQSVQEEQAEGWLCPWLGPGL